MCMCILPAYMTMYNIVQCPQRGQKIVLDILELELKTFVSCHNGTRNQPKVLCKSS